MKFLIHHANHYQATVPLINKLDLLGLGYTISIWADCQCVEILPVTIVRQKQWHEIIKLVSELEFECWQRLKGELSEKKMGFVNQSQSN